MYSDQNVDITLSKYKVNDKVFTIHDQVSHDIDTHVKDVKSLKLCELIVEYPKLYFCLTLSLHILSLILTVGFYLGGYDLLPIVFDSLPVDIVDDVDYLRGLAWDHKRDSGEIISQGEFVKTDYPRQTVEVEKIILVYGTHSKQSIFTKEYLKKIKEFEDNLFLLENIEDYCLLSRTDCEKPLSILRFFDGTFSNINDVFNDPGFDNIEAVLYEANNNNFTKGRIPFFVSKDYSIAMNEAFSPSTRTIISMALPLKGYPSMKTKNDEQKEAITQFIHNTFMPYGNKYFTNKTFGINVLFGGDSVFDKAIFDQVILDFLLIIASFLSIFIVMISQIRSLWITFFAVFSILTSFVGTNFIYNMVFGYKYFGIFHVLAIFIILGIGADDIFIFYDTWRETGLNTYKSTAHRLSHCYKRASVAMFYTSLTTGIAFLVSAFSPLMAVGTFGVFCSMLVAYNYFSVIFFFPGVIIVYHEYWSKYKCCCCCKRNQSNSISKPNIIVRFFEGVYFEFITHKIIRWFLLFFTLALLAVMSWQASTLQTTEGNVKFLKDDTMLGQYFSISDNFFEQSSFRKVYVHLAWGFKLQNRSKCDKNAPVCYGETSWNEDFDVNAEEPQRNLLKLCDTLLSLNVSVIDDLKIKKNYVSNEPEIFCFINEMKKFYEQKNISMPLYSSDVKKLMMDNSMIFKENLSDSWIEKHFFEIALSFWLVSDYTIFQKYGSNFGEKITSETKMTTIDDNMVYYYGTKLKFMSIQFNTSIDIGEVSYNYGIKLRDSWEFYAKKWLSDLGPTLEHGFQVTPVIRDLNVWHWFKIQRLLVKTAIQGIAIGLCVAIPILIIATKNIITGLLASFTLFMITISVIGIIPLAGWKLGFLESLNIVLIVGLSVDYVVHLAEGYSRAPNEKRLDKTKNMLREVGVSVLSGAATTLLASVFLTPAKITFFSEFGLFIFATIGFSFFYSLCFFTLAVSMIGPEKKCGSIDICAMQSYKLSKK